MAKTIRQALTDLVTLKLHRDKNGKDDVYVAAKSQAWESAIAALEAVPVDDGQMSGSEAIFGFAAWLSTQKYVPAIGSHNDCAWLADAIGTFCKVNGLTEPRDDWADRLTHPDPL